MANKDFLITFTTPTGSEENVIILADTKQMAIYKFCIEYEFQLIISIN
jgi:hypothetical protein